MPVNDPMEYKGYVGLAHYSAEDEVFHGKLEGIRELIAFEATATAGPRSSFQYAVEDYLQICRKHG